ncbi:MAG TPA: AmmeMemoRadiSam system protein B [Candidatus Caldiarchaeum subterraneum]|uniref:MEMO1 family protein EYH45_01915 n=1 Tax=Caldiarchaeum subterraneum TaxID=311458 RepID=A0A832ZVQ0_CALS0|nr:AmmeMemoRadiSam system protein B [Aigarchaeota archaeon]HIQ29301.1 AmmeMemoRadiSam system protein B [Candidatus Caldarchaeum subterraneum]
MGRRMPAVSGLFYAASEDALIKQIKTCFTSEVGPGRLPDSPIRAGDRKLPILISPHAGYMYSGPVAAHGYLLLEGRRKPRTVVVVGPNHYGVGAEVSIFPDGEWITPLGAVKIDHELAVKLAGESDIFSLDEASHSREHSIEVQLPFLQYLLRDFKFLPVCMLDQSESTAAEVGDALARVINGEDILLVASSDFTHYEPHEAVKRKDSQALDMITRLDVNGMYRVMYEHEITMCGYGAIAAVMTAAKRLGAGECRVLKHATSGDTGGDYSSVVGYASCVIELPER